MRWGLAVSAIGQTGQSEAIHSPEAWASVVVRLTMPAVWSIAVVCNVAISCWPSVLRTMSSPLEGPWAAGADGGGERLFRIDEFGLGFGQGRGERSDRFTGPGHGSPRSLAHQSSPPPISRLRSHPMPDCLLGVLGNEVLEFVLCSL